MVYLEPAQLRELKERSRAERVSVAELIRRAVQESLEGRAGVPPPGRDTYGRLVGLGSSGHSDIGEHHDDRLAAALTREHLR